MTIQKNNKKIEAETAAEVDKILKEGQDRARILQAEADRKLKQKQTQLKTQGEKQITIMRNIHLSEARRSARRIILSAKEDLIEGCFQSAKEKLQELKGEEYRKVLDRLIKESLALIGKSGKVTLTREEDKAIISAYPNLTVKPGIKPGLGGVIIESTDGKIVVDNTFDAILERTKEDIRTEVAQILYPESGESS